MKKVTRLNPKMSPIERMIRSLPTEATPMLSLVRKNMNKDYSARMGKAVNKVLSKAPESLLFEPGKPKYKMVRMDPIPINLSSKISNKKITWKQWNSRIGNTGNMVATDVSLHWSKAFYVVTGNDFQMVIGLDLMSSLFGGQK